MKRPGGFEPGGDPEEPRRPGPERERGREERGPKPAGRWAGRRFLSGGDADDSGAGAEPANSAPESAETVDLAEVRRSRGSEESRADVDAQPTDVVRVPARSRALARAAERFRSAPDPVRAAGREVKRAKRSRKRQERREQRRFSVQLRRRRRNWLIALGAVGALALTVLVGVFTPLMAVQDIRVEGASQLAPEDIEGALDRFSGVPLALVEDREIHRALEPFPLIQRYGVERVPPHTLVVRIEERTPVLAVEGDDGVELYDPAGVLLDRVEERPAGVPLATEGLRSVGSEAYSAAAEVLRDMPAEMRERISSAAATNPQNLSFELSNGIEVVWGEATKTNRKVEVLESMLQALEGKDVEVIDVSSTEGPVFR